MAQFVQIMGHLEIRAWIGKLYNPFCSFFNPTFRKVSIPIQLPYATFFILFFFLLFPLLFIFPSFIYFYTLFLLTTFNILILISSNFLILFLFQFNLPILSSSESLKYHNQMFFLYLSQNIYTVIQIFIHPNTIIILFQLLILFLRYTLIIMLKTTNTTESPSRNPKQLWNPNHDSELKINLETQEIKFNGDAVDYDNAIITPKGLIFQSTQTVIQIEPETLLKFHNGRVAQRYCHQLAKSLSRMSHFTCHSKNSRNPQKQKPIDLKHCLPLISRIPAQTKYIIQVLRHLSTSKIQLLFEDRLIFQYFLAIFSKASQQKDPSLNNNKRNIGQELNIVSESSLSEIIPECEEISDSYRLAHERVFCLMKIFCNNHVLIGFLSDVNVCLVSKKISEWVNKGLLTVQEGNADRKTRRATQNNKQAIEKLQNMVKIIRSALALIGNFRKAVPMLNEIIMIDEVHHWISAQIDNISKNQKARKIFVQLLGLICLINKSFAGKLYSQKQKSINYILTSEITKFYDQKAQEKGNSSFLESLLQIADEAVIEKNEMAKKKSLGMIVVANFIEMFQWIGLEELTSIATIFKSNYEAINQLSKPLSSQITKKLTSIQKLNLPQQKKHRILLVQLYKLILALNQSFAPISKTTIHKLEKLKGKNQMLCNIYTRINSAYNPIKIQDYEQEI